MWEEPWALEPRPYLCLQGLCGPGDWLLPVALPSSPRRSGWDAL